MTIKSGDIYMHGYNMYLATDKGEKHVRLNNPDNTSCITRAWSEDYPGSCTRVCSLAEVIEKLERIYESA